MKLVVKSNLYSISHTFYLYFYASTFIKKQTNQSSFKFTFDLKKLDNNTLQSLMFNTLSLDLSYKNLSYCEWLMFIILIFLDTRTTSEFDIFVIFFGCLSQPLQTENTHMKMQIL